MGIPLGLRDNSCLSQRVPEDGYSNSLPIATGMEPGISSFSISWELARNEESHSTQTTDSGAVC